ncbi:MAG: GTPase RsgA, partial [bacterium]|nr:GTPase RsgA [bacterium]
MKYARISSVHKGMFSITGDYGEMYAEITGRLAYNADSSTGYPVVGDNVLVDYLNDNTRAVIYEVMNRKSVIKRKLSGNKVDYQVIAANIDYAFIIQALEADFNINRLERYLVMVKEGQVVPVVLLSKKDLISEAETQEKIMKIKE